MIWATPQYQCGIYCTDLFYKCKFPFRNGIPSWQIWSGQNIGFEVDVLVSFVIFWRNIAIESFNHCSAVRTILCPVYAVIFGLQTLIMCYRLWSCVEHSSERSETRQQQRLIASTSHTHTTFAFAQFSLINRLLCEKAESAYVRGTESTCVCLCVSKCSAKLHWMVFNVFKNRNKMSVRICWLVQPVINNDDNEYLIKIEHATRISIYIFFVAHTQSQSSIMIMRKFVNR